MVDSRLVLVDGEAHTASLLATELTRRGLGVPRVAASARGLPALVAGVDPPDLVIVNHRYQQADGFEACKTAKRFAPESSVLVVVAPGPALLELRAWAQLTRCVDVIVEKPLFNDRFFLLVSELLARRASAREVRTRAERLSNLVPAGALLAAADNADPQAELFDAAVLFTDIRDSSRLITQKPAREFFDLLNRVLSAQAARIEANQGSIVKYTGDGVMAIFRGMGRSYLALRCGLELAAMSRTQPLPYGVGIAQGLVLAGLIGDASRTGRRRQFDVIGATAHLAARLCAMAQTGELVAPSSMNAVANVRTPAPRPLAKVSIRGFDRAIDCVSFNTDDGEPGASR